MPEFQITSPTGKKYRVKAPEGASKDDVLRRVQAFEQGQSRPEEPPAEKPAPKVTTREDAIKARARQEYEADRKKTSVRNLGLPDAVAGPIDAALDYSNSALANVGGFLGIGPNILAGYRSITRGTPFKDEQTYAVERNLLEQNESTPGMITGALMGGSGAVKAGQAAVNVLERLSPKAADAVRGLTYWQKGQKYRNAGRIVGTGTVMGAAQAGATGGDVGEGAAEGAFWSTVIPGGINLVRGTGSRIYNYTRPSSSSVPRGAQETIHQDPAKIRARHEDMVRTTGNPNIPVVAALNDGDYRRVVDNVAQNSEEAANIARGNAKEWVKGLSDRMITHVKNAGRSVATPIIHTLNDLAVHRDRMSDRIMDPIRNKKIDLTQIPVKDLELEVTQKAGGRITGLSEKVKAALARVSDDDLRQLGLDPAQVSEQDRMVLRMFSRNPVDVTVGEVDTLRKMLNRAAKGARNNDNTLDAEIFKNASDAIRKHVGDTYPEYETMLKAHAANQRMIEGFETAASGKRISEIGDANFADNLRTDEGRIGMKLGELYRQREAVAKSGSSAINTTRELASGKALTRPPSNVAQPGTVTENVGAQAAEDLAKKAGIEYDTTERMLQAGNISATKAPESSLDNPESLFYGIAALSPTAMIATKARFFTNFIKNIPTNMNPKVAENLTEMLFSGNPDQAQQALRALERVGGSKILGDAIRSATSTQAIPAAAGIMGGSGEAAPPPEEQAAPDIPNEPPPAPEASAQFSPQVQDLASRMEQVESGGRQDAVSEAGAIGVMQVMPATAPLAAELAGVPFDEERYKTDEEYNRLLGTAYLADLLEQFDGDEAKAVAAYHAGPGKKGVRGAVAKGGDDWLSHLGPKTRAYVEKVLG